jgi:hypothetical protein
VSPSTGTTATPNSTPSTSPDSTTIPPNDTSTPQ